MVHQNDSDVGQSLGEVPLSVRILGSVVPPQDYAMSTFFYLPKEILPMLNVYAPSLPVRTIKYCLDCPSN